MKDESNQWRMSATTTINTGLAWYSLIPIEGKRFGGFCKCLEWEVWELCQCHLLFLISFFICISPVLSMALNCIIMHLWLLQQHVERVYGQDTLVWAIIRELQQPHLKALRYPLTTIEDSGYWQHGMSMIRPKDDVLPRTHYSPNKPSPWAVQWLYPLCLCGCHLYDFFYMSSFLYDYLFIYYPPYVLSGPLYPVLSTWWMPLLWAN